MLIAHEDFCPVFNTQHHQIHMKTKILMPVMAIMLLLAACNKQPADNTAFNAQKSASTVAVPAILYQADINPKDVFTVSRNGNHVKIAWTPDFSGCKRIKIYRNATGILKDRIKVAELPANRKDYEDSLPDAYACWYWLFIGLPDGKDRIIGPLRVPPDVDKVGNYTTASDDAQLVVQRTETSVVVAWRLPEIKYKTIKITRNSSPKYEKKKNPRQTILTTLEGAGELVDKLPDSDADYWYWVEATKADGSILSQGPIKAEFSVK